ncbi:MAG: hypothetical protein ACK5LF_21250, partial [Bacteroides xylanisolvens]
KAGKKVGDMTNKVHIDGFNNLAYWTVKTEESARNQFFYYYESSLTAMRVGPRKMNFATKERYFDYMVQHTMPQLFNLRKDPFEKYDDVTGFHLMMEKSWVMQPAIGLLTEHLKTVVDFPPRQASASLDINKAIEKILSAGSRNN